MAARAHLRERFLRARVAISGANFAVAETGTLAVVESEGNGRMCLTLPQTLITVMGIEKLVPTWRDLEVFLQLLPRSSTGERMNPYTSLWTGVTPGDGPQEFHLVLLDNGRTAVLADEVGREALHCIRCSACLNVCPVYERTGGHAYGSVYPGPIGAILSPQLTGVEDETPTPCRSRRRLCGACYDACPVAIDIPSILVHLRAEYVEAQERTHPRGRARSARCRRPCRTRGCWRLAQKAAGLGRFLARGRPTLPAALPPAGRGVDPHPRPARPRRPRRSPRPGPGSTAHECPRGGARPDPDRARRPAGPRRRSPATTAPATTGRPTCCATCWSTGWRTTGPSSSAARRTDVAATVAAALDRGLGPGWAAPDVVVAPGLPARLAAGRVDEDDGRPATDLVAFAAAVTGVAVAIAETGTLVLDGSPRGPAGPRHCCPTAWSAW